MKNLNNNLLRNSLFLVFLLALTSCNKLGFEWKESASLSDTEWVITRYDNTLTNISEFPSDTLRFIDDNSYQINGGVERDYFLQSLNTAEQDEYLLDLSDCSTFGGDFTAWIDQFSIDEGEVTNKLFNSGDNEIIVWMEKI